MANQFVPSGTAQFSEVSEAWVTELSDEVLHTINGGWRRRPHRPSYRPSPTPMRHAVRLIRLYLNR